MMHRHLQGMRRPFVLCLIRIILADDDIGPSVLVLTFFVLVYQSDNQVTKKTEHPDSTVTESHKTGLKTAIFPVRKMLNVYALYEKVS